MPCFVRIGRIPENTCGVGSRGYQVLQRKTTVICRWGRVVIETPATSLFHWGNLRLPQEKRYSFRSQRLSVEFVARKVKQLLTPRKGYQRLPTTQAIGKAAKR
jgi:hypothetical protein